MIRRSIFRVASSVSAILILAAGCSDLGPTVPEFSESSHALTSAERNVPVIRDPRTPGLFRATITHHGGTMDFGIGSLQFLPGSLDRPARISALVADGEVHVEFGPEGLHFNPDAQPILRFSAAGLDDPASYSIVQVDADGATIEQIASVVDGSFIVGRLEHFSAYALAKD